MMKQEYMNQEHARLSPSKADIWLTCGGSVNLIESNRDSGTLRPDTGSVHSRRGTAAHKLIESRLSQRDGPIVSKVLFDHKANRPLFIDPEEKIPDIELLELVDIDSVNKALDWVSFRLLVYGGALEIEKRAIWNWDLWGTADIVISETGSSAPNAPALIVADYKSGAGLIHPDAPQIRIYAAAIAMEKELDDDAIVRVAVIQPKATDWGLDPVRYNDERVADLLGWMSGVSEWADRIVSGEDLPLVPGEKQCRWCPAAAICPALIRTVDEVFAAATGTEPRTLGPEAISDYLDKRPVLDVFFDHLKTFAMQMIQNGQEIPGWKVVEGITHRRYAKSVDELLGLFAILPTVSGKRVKKTEYTKIGVISPGDALKLFTGQLTDKGMDRLQAVIYKPKGAPTLVPVADKRPGQAPAAIETLFKNIEE